MYYVFELHTYIHIATCTSYHNLAKFNIKNDDEQGKLNVRNIVKNE